MNARRKVEEELRDGADYGANGRDRAPCSTMPIATTSGRRKPTLEARALVVGGEAAGKSSLVAMASRSTFPTMHHPTIGVDYATTTIFQPNYNVLLQIWELSGARRFESLFKSYINDSQVVVVVYDLTDEQSLSAAREWLVKLTSFEARNLEAKRFSNACASSSQTIADHAIEDDDDDAEDESVNTSTQRTARKSRYNVVQDRPRSYFLVGTKADLLADDTRDTACDCETQDGSDLVRNAKVEGRWVEMKQKSSSVASSHCRGTSSVVVDIDVHQQASALAHEFNCVHLTASARKQVSIRHVMRAIAEDVELMHIAPIVEAGEWVNVPLDAPEDERRVSMQGKRWWHQRDGSGCGKFSAALQQSLYALWGYLFGLLVCVCKYPRKGTGTQPKQQQQQQQQQSKRGPILPLSSPPSNHTTAIGAS